MLTVVSVKDWIKTLGIGQFYYAGKLDSKKNMSIGVYSRKTPEPLTMALGGGANKTYYIKPISVLVHWSNDYGETEIIALKLYNKLQDVRKIKICDTVINHLLLANAEPIDIGTDDKGVYERVIEFDLIYERGNEDKC